MHYSPKPLGSRVHIRILNEDLRTKAGLIVPTWKGDPQDPMGPVKSSPPLQFVEVIAVGEGRYDPDSGTYRGSKIQVGGKYMMRAGVSSQMHMDALPVRNNEYIVLEDTLVCSVEFEASEAVAVKPKLLSVQ